MTMTREPIHPGETLREDLDALSMSAAELARRIEVPVNRITEILNGRRAVTADTALRLGRFFGTSGEFWLNLQKLYELRKVRRSERAGRRSSCCRHWTPPTGRARRANGRSANRHCGRRISSLQPANIIQHTAPTGGSGSM